MPKGKESGTNRNIITIVNKPKTKGNQNMAKIMSYQDRIDYFNKHGVWIKINR